MRLAMLEIFDSLPASVRRWANEAQVDILKLGKLWRTGRISEKHLAEIAEAQARSSLALERTFIDKALIK